MALRDKVLFVVLACVGLKNYTRMTVNVRVMRVIHSNWKRIVAHMLGKHKQVWLLAIYPPAWDHKIIDIMHNLYL